MLLCGRLGREQAGRFQVWGGWRGSQLRWLEEMPVHAGECGHRCQAGKVKPAGSNHLLLASLQPAPGMPLHRGSGFPGWERQCFRGIAGGTMDSQPAARSARVPILWHALTSARRGTAVPTGSFLIQHATVWHLFVLLHTSSNWQLALPELFAGQALTKASEGGSRTSLSAKSISQDCT